jgi:hypothetical protein
MNAHGNLIAEPFVFLETSFALLHHRGALTEFRLGPHTYAPERKRGVTSRVRPDWEASPEPNPPFGDAPWRNGERQ